MPLNLRSILLANSTRRILACLIGFTLWYMISAQYTATKTIHIPLTFYNAKDCTIDAPQSIIITIKGPRKTIRKLDTQAIKALIDAQRLPKHPSLLTLSAEQLNLHKDLLLVNYTPTLIKKNTQKNA